MGQFVLIVISIYILYYGGNIIYDLFFKKEKIIQDDNNLEEFSISDFAEEIKEDVNEVGIDDVENMITPQKEEYIEEGQEQEPNMEQMRERFETEQILEEQENEPKLSEKERKKQLEQEKEKARKERRKKHYDMMRMAETSVQILENVEGQKVYQIV